MTKTLVFFIRIYQKAVSPLIGTTCRFSPTCSEYAIEALGKYGLIKGLKKTAARILRCHPFNEGGYDPA